MDKIFNSEDFEFEQDPTLFDHLNVLGSYYESSNKVQDDHVVLSKGQSIQLCTKEDRKRPVNTICKILNPFNAQDKLALALEHLNKGFILSLGAESNLSLYRYPCCHAQPFYKNPGGDYEKVDKETTVPVNYHFASNAGKCIVLGRDPRTSAKPAPITIHVTPHEIGDHVDNEESSMLLLSE